VAYVGRVSALALAALALAGCSRSQSASPAEGAGAGSATPSAQVAKAKQPFGSACVADGECASAACFHKHTHDKGGQAAAQAGGGHEHAGTDDSLQADGYCSIRCEEDSDCPNPPTSGHCGGRGMCKR
jgi:hypothetical protein